MTAPQNVSPGPNPPQFDSLSRRHGAGDADASAATTSASPSLAAGLRRRCCPCRLAVPRPLHARAADQISAADRRHRAEGRRRAARASAPRSPHRARAASSTTRRSSRTAATAAGRGCRSRRGDVRWLRAKQVELNAMLAHAGGRQRRDDRGRLRRQRGPRRVRRLGHALGGAATSRATPPPRCIPTCAGCRRWRPWWLRTASCPVILTSSTPASTRLAVDASAACDRRSGPTGRRTR